MKSYIIAAAVTCFAVTAFAQSVDVSYADKHATVQISSMQHADVSAKGHDGVTHTYSCVALKDVLASVQPPTGEKLRGAGMTLVVIASAKDHYHASFSLAELDESIGDKQAYVCDKQDGKALGESDGPLRMVIPSDKRPARWVRMLTTLDIRQIEP